MPEAQSPLVQQAVSAMHAVPHAFDPVGQTQMPLVQVAPEPQSALEQQPSLGAQMPLAQNFFPGAQPQAFEMHNWVAGQSVSTQQPDEGMQRPPHSLNPDGHPHPPPSAGHTQVPELHVAPGGHSVDEQHASAGTHVPLAHSFLPGVQPQTVAAQTWVGGQSGSVQQPEVGTHHPPQDLVPAGQTHSPAAQVAPATLQSRSARQPATVPPSPSPPSTEEGPGKQRRCAGSQAMPAGQSSSTLQEKRASGKHA